MKKLVVILAFVTCPFGLFANMPVIDMSSIATAIQGAITAYESAVASYNQFQQYAQLMQNTYNGLSDSLKGKNENWFDTLSDVTKQSSELFAGTLDTIDQIDESVEDFGGKWGIGTEELKDHLGKLRTSSRALGDFGNAFSAVSDEDKGLLGFGEFDFDNTNQIMLETMKSSQAGFDELATLQKQAQMEDKVDGKVSELEEMISEEDRMEDNIKETSPVIESPFNVELFYEN